MPYKNEYSQYCSHDCQKHSSIQANRGIATKIKKYGENNINNFKKAHLTRVSKYGSYHPKDFPDKVKSTKKKKYGNENYVNVEKMKQTVKKHREENPNYYYDREQKTKMTKVKNGHDPNWNNRKKFKQTVNAFSNDRKEEIKQKRKQTCKCTYGYEFPTQNPDVQKRRRDTCQDLYKVPCTLNISYVEEASIKKIRENAWNDFMSHEHEVEPMFSKNDFIANNSNDIQWKWKCKKCCHEFQHKWRGFNRKCPICHPLTYHETQRDIVEFIKNICPNDNVIENCRYILNDKKELDIVDIDKKIAIEFNGLIWHNVDKQLYRGRKIDRMYHFNKTTECNDKNYQLIHIFEDQWLENSNLCRSRLKKIFAKDLLRHIDASCCTIDYNVSKECQMKFIEKYSFNENHFDVACALMHNGHVVAMMTFAKCKSKIYDWEIIEYAEVYSIMVDHGFSTLVKNFASRFEISKLCYKISRDWNSIESIDASMKVIDVVEPNMYWMNRQSKWPSWQITHLNMHEWLNKVENEKSFLQNMNNNNFYRIYDSGSFLCEYINEEQTKTGSF